MGLTFPTIANPARSEDFPTERFLVDSGAAYSVVQRPDSATLSSGLYLGQRRPDRTPCRRCAVSLQGTAGAAPVVFGEPGDSNLLGIVTLEALGYVLDPLKRELRALPMLLAGLRIR